jgi:hypothetical protein
MLKQFVQFISSLFGQKKVRYPESDFVITLTEESIEVVRPDGVKEMIRWDDVQTISVATTDKGPFAPDVWFVLLGNKSQCLFPQGAPRSDEAYERISQFDGFDFETFIKSMCSTENAQFLLWQRQPTSSIEPEPS